MCINLETYTCMIVISVKKCLMNLNKITYLKKYLNKKNVKNQSLFDFDLRSTKKKLF